MCTYARELTYAFGCAGIRVFMRQVNYQRANHKKWDLSMAPRGRCDFPNSAQSGEGGGGSPRELLSKQVQDNDRHHFNCTDDRADREFYTLKSDMVGIFCEHGCYCTHAKKFSDAKPSTLKLFVVRREFEERVCGLVKAIEC
jgi:hypothetical protein